MRKTIFKPQRSPRLILGVLAALCLAEPWGKDTDLIEKKIAIEKNGSTAVSDLLIDFHQKIISPCDGPRSHFIPCSSTYARRAIRKYGFLHGFGMGCDRLMRENSEEWVYRKTADREGRIIKYDPVP